jgi:PTH1 family peptidyl-tRNA hydrolase
MTPETSYLLVGFGNPGREYRDTRHNIGFMLIDRVAVRLDARGMKLQSKAIVMTALYEERKIILAKPQTYESLRSICAGIIAFLQTANGKPACRS